MNKSSAQATLRALAPFFQVDEEKSLRNEIKFKFSSWAPFSTAAGTCLGLMRLIFSFLVKGS